MENEINNDKPIAVFKAGLVKASVWENAQKGKDGVEYKTMSVTLARSYKDKEGNWKNTSSLNNNDVAKAVLVLRECYKFINMREE